MSDTATKARELIAQLLARHAVTMGAVFVPQSMSRHSTEKTHTLNWRVSFTGARGAFALDYSQGIGHVPHWHEPRTLYEESHAGKPWETGRYHPIQKRGAYNSDYSMLARALPAPDAADMLYCITLDASAADYSFDDWCAECGYDNDSRKAEHIYQQCRRQSQDARRILGAELLKDAADILQDY